MIVFIRHGRTEWNETGRVQGFKNAMLTKDSCEFCKSFQGRFSDSIWKCYSSSRRRSVDTAKHLGFRDVVSSPLLDERFMGRLEGYKGKYLRKKFGSSSLEQGNRKLRVESYDSVLRRAKRFFHCLEENTGRKVAVITHARFMICAMQLVLGRGVAPNETFDNLGCLVLRLNGTSYKVDGVNIPLDQVLNEASSALKIAR
ncbi:histidine phosphatase family protein [Phaeobacter inhibens]|uniref:histidine phosphatase family protein n=1 Tax=Phaeobacter inhibens TaxID=221822 RepID=UPI0009E8E0DB|nr:histidine phosphatase family protein [Phaeobacter inhibens]WHP67317.1 histidine phosphatase family protein [Phaeobacter inhibens]